jgi:N-acetylneuraminic acid mutarotase
MPGSRYRAVSWQDASGNFWLFGGKGFDSTGTQGDLNDLWEYNPGTNQWTWVSGSEVIDHVGSYGTKGSSNGLNNFPGARSGGAGWYDSGHLWMFGGFGLAAAGTVGDLNDLWKFGIDSLASDYHQWTWVGGANSTGQSGSFGAAGSAGSNNIPPPRRSAVSWTDNSGNFWMFGGIRNSDDDLSDLWKYNPIANQWTWMSGWNAPKQSGTYGSQGSPAIANVPGARDLSVSWKDNAGKLWLFGGQGYDAQGSVGYLNDLWSFVPQ